MVEESINRREDGFEDSDDDMNDSYTAFTCLGSGSMVIIVSYIEHGVISHVPSSSLRALQHRNKYQ